MAARTSLVAETLRLFDKRSPEEIESDRIAGKVLRGVARGKMDWPVRSNPPLTTAKTTHDAEVYARAADRLRGDGLEIEAHRFDEHFTSVWFNLGGLAVIHDWEQPCDRVVVKFRDGEPVPRERIPQTEPNWVGRVYPPEEL